MSAIDAAAQGCAGSAVKAARRVLADMSETAHHSPLRLRRYGGGELTIKRILSLRAEKIQPKSQNQRHLCNIAKHSSINSLKMTMLSEVASFG
ncbi:MAG: hypothetical protein LUE15_05865 [Oscillospiraceae bacterium]|nr:hypothetical protein [Oscillospiraceae bacterium]